jgi:hypothetical protein
MALEKELYKTEERSRRAADRLLKAMNEQWDLSCKAWTLRAELGIEED